MKILTKLLRLLIPLAEFATFLEDEMYDHLFRNASYTSPTTVYAALFDGTASTANLEAGTLTGEISGNDYARTAITFGAPTDGLGANSGAVTFPPANGGNWGTITYMAIMDSSGSGVNVLMYTALDSTVVINDGNQFQFNVGDIDVDFKPAGSEISDAIADELYDHVCRNAAYTSPTNVYLAMFTSTATAGELDANTQTNEVADTNAYVRLILTATAPSNGAGSNSGDHTFAAASGGNWGTLRWVAVVDNITHNAGAILNYAQLDSDVVINDGNTLQFNGGDFDLLIQ